MASDASPPGSGTTLAVLHVAAPGAVGGLESVLALLAGGQGAAGHKVAVAAVLDRDAGESPFLARLARANVPVHTLRLPPRAYITERRRLMALIRDTRPDVVHTHGYRADIQGAAAAWRLGVPTVTTVHGFTGGGWKNRLYERLQVRSFRRFDAVVAVSTPLAARLRAAGVPPARLHVIANAAAFDPPLSRADARRQFGVNDDAFLVGWIGRISHEKGLDILIEALARSLPPCKVVVVGTGRETAAVRELARRHGVEDRVRWAGVVANAGRLCTAFDCFVLSSRTEGTPMVLFEAMAAGVPIVAAAVGGVPDVLSDREALLVPAEKPDALAAAITSVHADPEAAHARALAARRRLDAERRPEPWVERYASLYGSVLANPRRAIA